MKPSIFLAFLLMILLAGCSSAAPLNGTSGQEEPAAEAPLPVATLPLPLLLPTATPALPAPEQTPLPPASIPETRRLTLEFPPKIRVGVGSDLVRLTLEVDSLGIITPTAVYQGHVVTGEPIQIPDLYETHNVTAEAQLDLAGFIVQPPGAIYEPLKRGQSATFLWSITPTEIGEYRGVVWLHLNFENRQTGEKDRIAVSAQIVEIRAVDFFGLSFNVARAGGIIGSVISGVIGFPFLEDIVKLLFKRKKKKKSH